MPRRRHTLTGAQRENPGPLIPKRGRPGTDDRQFVNAVLSVAKAGVPRRGLPERPGDRNSVWRRFRRWSEPGRREAFAAAPGEPDLTEPQPDGTSIRTCRQASNPRRLPGEEKYAHARRRIGRSRGGLMTKLDAARDAAGRPGRLALTAGQRHDVIGVPGLLCGLHPAVVVADRAYDGDPRGSGSRPPGPPPASRRRRPARSRTPTTKAFPETGTKSSGCSAGSSSSAASPPASRSGPTPSSASAGWPRSSVICDKFVHTT